jgi:hypothetical protein
MDRKEPSCLGHLIVCKKIDFISTQNKYRRKPLDIISSSKGKQADAFDAMTSTRPYRKGMALEAAIEQIAKNLNTQFERTFRLNLIALAKSGELDGIIGHSEAGIPMRDCPICGRDCERIRKRDQTFAAEATESGNNSNFRRNFTLVGKDSPIRTYFAPILGKKLVSLTIP